MLQAVVAIAIPLLVFLTMVVVGLQFVVQVPFVIAAIALFRFRTAPARGVLVEVGHS